MRYTIIIFSLSILSNYAECWAWDDKRTHPAISERAAGRFYNHFHNPLKSWDNAGLNSIVNGESDLLWAQNEIENEWAWQKVKHYYDLALTAPTETERSANFAKILRAGSDHPPCSGHGTIGPCP